MDVPNEFIENYEKGTKLLNEKMYKEALPYFAAAIALLRDPAVLINYSIALKETGDFRQGRELLQEAYEKVPETDADVRAIICYNMGNSFRDEGRQKEAINWYKEAISLRKDHIGQHFNLGQAYFVLEEFDNALEQYNYILAHIDSQDPKTLTAIKVIEDLKSSDMSLPANNKLRKLPPYKWKDSIADQLSSEMLKLLFDNAPLDKIRENIEEILRREPENEDETFWAFSCNTYTTIAMKNKEEIALASKAIEMGNKAINLHEQGRYLPEANLYVLYEGLGGAYFLKDEYSEVKKYCRKALDIKPDSERMQGLIDIVNDYEKQQKPVTQDSSVKKSGCFIATAVCDSEYSPEVLVLRSFRDEVLLHSKIGRKCINFYYDYSPAIADEIRSSSFLRIIIRNIIVRPMVIISKRLINLKREGGKL